MAITGADFDHGNFTFALQSALSAYSDEMYTSAKKLSGTGIVGSNAQIDPTTETYIGQTRFFKPYSTQAVNVANVPSALSSTEESNKQTYTSDYLTYVKTVRTHGAQEINVQRVISQMDGLAKIARDFGEVRAQDEHDTVLDVLQGVARTEALRTTSTYGGIRNFGYDYNVGGNISGDSNTNRGFFVDVNAAGAFGTNSSNRGLLSDSSVTSAGYGAIRAENLFTALSLGFADYEPDYVYMITSPEIMTQLRVANIVDQTTVTEGNLEFQTVFGGKFRLIMTRANQGNFSGIAAVDSDSSTTTFLVKPGAIEMAMLDVPMPVEMYRNANTYNGGGSTDIWYRWGYVAHAMGYDWTGASDRFVARTASGDNDTYAVNGDGSSAVWARKFDALNLGILPIFHA